LEAKVPWGPAEQRGEHLAGLVAIVVDRLLAHDHEPGLFALDHGFERLGDSERLQLGVGLHQDGAVGTHGQCGAQGFLAGLGAQADRDDLAGRAGLLQANRLFHGDLVEGVHRHLDVGRFDTRSVSLGADLDVVIDHPLYRDEDLHLSPPTLFIFIIYNIFDARAGPHSSAVRRSHPASAAKPRVNNPDDPAATSTSSDRTTGSFHRAFSASRRDPERPRPG
jgi:hypothetical protein